MKLNLNFKNAKPPSEDRRYSSCSGFQVSSNYDTHIFQLISIKAENILLWKYLENKFQKPFIRWKPRTNRLIFWRFEALLIVECKELFLTINLSDRRRSMWTWLGNSKGETAFVNLEGTNAFAARSFARTIKTAYQEKSCTYNLLSRCGVSWSPNPKL